MKFAYKLQELRRGSGMSQEEFAELLGVSRQSVSKWESGKGYPEIDKLIFISNYFNTSLDLLLKDTPEYGNNSSISMSTSKRVRKKRKHNSSICLSKSANLQSTVKENPIAYANDPLPMKTTQSNPLVANNTPYNSEIKAVHNNHSTSINNISHRKSKKRLDVSKICILGGVLAVCVSSLFVAVFTSLTTDSYSYEMDSIVTTAYDEVELEEDTYDSYWEELYDDSSSLSIYENELLDTMNYGDESILVDEDGNVYSTSIDVVYAYFDAQNDMRNSLNCMLLYNKYVYFDFYDNAKFLNVYSYDLDDWIIINECMLRIYTEQWNNDSYYTIPEVYPQEQTYMEYYYDILSTDAEEWEDYNNSPFETVYRINMQSNAIVSYDILDLCISASEERKYLSMQQYIDIYEKYNNRYELINYDGNIIFVPKEFIMINASEIDD